LFFSSDLHLHSPSISAEALAPEHSELIHRRIETIQNERKRSRDAVEIQAKKMMKFSDSRFPAVELGATVRLPIPDVNRARGSSRNLLAVVMAVDNTFYKLCELLKNFATSVFTGLLILLRKFMTGSTAGVLKNRYARSEFTPCPEANLLNAEDVIASAGDTEIPIREAAAHNSVAGSQGYKRCNC